MGDGANINYPYTLSICSVIAFTRVDLGPIPDVVEADDIDTCCGPSRVMCRPATSNEPVA